MISKEKYKFAATNADHKDIKELSNKIDYKNISETTFDLSDFSK